MNDATVAAKVGCCTANITTSVCAMSVMYISNDGK